MKQLIPTLDRLGSTCELLGQWANETGVVRRDRFAHDTPDGRIEFDRSILFVEDGHVTMEHAYGWPDESLALGFSNEMTTAHGSGADAVAGWVPHRVTHHLSLDPLAEEFHRDRLSGLRRIRR